jgi:peptide/nickel transport system substrate-binding protein
VIWSDQYYEHLDFNIRPIESIVNSGAFAGWDLDGDEEGPFGDIRLRQAVAYCLDRQAVVDEVYLNQIPPAITILPPDHPLMAPRLPDLVYDPQAGMALLDEIGWIEEDGNANTPRVAQGVTGVPDGTPLTFSYESTDMPLRVQAVAILAESLAQCGFGVNVEHMSSRDWLARGPEGRLFGRQFDLGQYAWGSSFGLPCQVYMGEDIPGDPGEVDIYGNLLYPNGWDGMNDSGYSSPQYDAACNQVLQTLPGEPNYVENAWQVQYILADDLPIIPLHTRFFLNATRPDFCNFTPASAYFSELWNLEKFAYGTACP